MGATNPNAGGAPGGGGKGGMGMNRGPGGMGTPPTAQNWGSRNPAGTPSWMNSSGLTPMQGAFGNFTPPTPQPQEPIGGYINGQPAQWHYQAEALNNPQPRTTAAGLPAGGILARLYGG